MDIFYFSLDSNNYNKFTSRFLQQEVCLLEVPSYLNDGAMGNAMNPWISYLYFILSIPRAMNCYSPRAPLEGAEEAGPTAAEATGVQMSALE